ncbi:winged helix-turn-helix transcriptional regulator [Streptacidiphilus cavernicola]|uniref:Winged helix-turn-helix transcriptional regulator n=1 Tax=Streptacidiphilus cavernicola TaxID=3342716 RepID=A0ABV6W3E1_9ACTN
MSAIPPFTVYDKACPSRLVLEHVTSRWGVLALAALRERTYRFSELRRRIEGVSEKMLAQTLQTLERDGFVLRVAHPEIPPRVEYSLTGPGREAAELVVDLVQWVEQQMPQVIESQRQRDALRAEAS